MRPVFALLAPAVLALAACKAEGAPDAPRAEAPRPVQVAEVRLAPAEDRRAYTGTVRARREADIGFRVGGRIAARLVDVGAQVTAGQVLARMDPSDIALALRAAEADLAAAEAEARRAAADAARSRSLLAAGHVAAAFDEQRQATARSTAERVASARANLELARNRRAYAELRAPDDGVVTAVLAEAGQVVPEGQAVLRIANPGERELVVQVPEAAVASLAAATVEARFWARPQQAMPARLRELAPQAETALRTYAARFSLPDAPGWVALGMTGTVHLAAAAAPVATLPLSALHDRGQGPIVLRVENDRVVPVPVEVVALSELTVTLRGPLAERDRVVAMGAHTLDPGIAVRVASTRVAATLR